MMRLVDMFPDLEGLLYGVNVFSHDILLNYLSVNPEDLDSYSENVDWFCVYCGLSV